MSSKLPVFSYNEVSGALNVKNLQVYDSMTFEGPIRKKTNGPLQFISPVQFVSGLTTNGPQTINSDMTINGQLVIKNPITISVPTLFGGADLFKPTIQEAIDYFAGRHTMNGSIVVAPGKYVETLRLDKSSSAASGADVRDAIPNSGFRIIGDSRSVVSRTYLQGGNNINPLSISSPSLGTDLVGVTLSNVGNVITAVLASGPVLDFVVAGVVVGDKIKIRNSSAETWTTATVTAVMGNTISHDGGTIDVNGLRSAFVICPNVQILGNVASQGIISAFSFNADLVGLWLDTSVANGSVALPANTLFINQSLFTLRNCLFDNSTSNLASSNIALFGNSNVEVNGSNSINTLIGGATGIEMVANCGWIGGYLSVFDCSTGVLALGLCVFVLPGLYQFVSGATGVTGTNGALFSLLRINIFKATLGISLAGNSTANIGTGGFVSKIDCANASNSTGVAVGRGSYSRFIGSVTISNAFTGISIARNSRSSVDSAAVAVTFTNVVESNIHTEYPSTWDSMRSTATPGNVVTYTASSQSPTAFTGTIAATTLTISAVATGSLQTGQRVLGAGVTVGTFITAQTVPLLVGEALGGIGRYTVSVISAVGPIPMTSDIALSNEYENQVINSTSALGFSLNPAATAGGTSRYLGKSFTIRSADAAAHTLALIPSTGGMLPVSVSFVGAGAGTVATFSAANDYLVFTVLSATVVLITAKSAGVTVA